MDVPQPHPSGGPLGTQNLSRANFSRHARYLATVAQHARQHWDVTFTSVAPFNEPSTVGGWHAERTQEGCVLLVDAQEPIIEYLRHELDLRGLGDVDIAASDETHVDIADVTWHLLPENARKQVGRINVHGYQSR